MVITDADRSGHTLAADAVESGIERRNAELVHQGAAAGRAGEVKAGPADGRGAEALASRRLGVGAEAIVQADMEGVRGGLGLDVDATERNQVEGGVLAVAIFALQRQTVGQRGFEAEAGGEAVAFPVIRNADIRGQVEMLVAVAAEHVDEGFGRREIAGASDQVEAVIGGDIACQHAAQRGKLALDPAETGGAVDAEQHALAEHVVIADGEFTENTLGADAVEGCVDQGNADFVDETAGARPDADIYARPIMTGLRRMLERIGSQKRCGRG